MNKEFFYGASVYPEILSREEQGRVLNLFKAAHYNILRLSESAWGNIEKTPGQYDFSWIHFFLDEMQKRGMKAILGTCSYIVPQWLPAQYPEILLVYSNGAKAHSMGRHSVCRNHPIYRKALHRFLQAYIHEFSHHPVIIGWQLDNEIDLRHASRENICHNPACEKAWTNWLKKEYRTADEFNKRLGLNQWGLQVSSLESVTQPRETPDGELPALYNAYWRFKRDDIFDFLLEQKNLLRKAGIKGFITHDWVSNNLIMADDPKAREVLDISGLNVYQASEDKNSYWATQSYKYDLHRSSSHNNRFIVSETRIGVTGGPKIWGPAYLPEQFINWMIQPAAFGAIALMHWSGNRFTGGHWPHWGGGLNWKGEPEPDYELSKKAGEFFHQWGKTLVSTNVKSSAAVITGYDHLVTLACYPHSTDGFGREVIVTSFHAFHRLGIGVDAINPAKNHKIDLDKYQTIILAAAVVYENPSLTKSLVKFVEKGGTIIITPLTGYQTLDGLFRKEGFAAELEVLMGCKINTVRQVGKTDEQKSEKKQVAWNAGFGKKMTDLKADGFCELISLGSGKTVAKFNVNDPTVNKLPAAVLNKIGKGKVLKLGYWPGAENYTLLIHALLHKSDNFVRCPLDPNLLSVPRSDGSLFIFNTCSQPIVIHLLKKAKDRITSRKLGIGKYRLKPYEVLWMD